MKSNQLMSAARMTRDAGGTPGKTSRGPRGEEMRFCVRFAMAGALFVPSAIAQSQAGKTDRSKSADAIECWV
ncbi:MAG: hypothetical protein Ct9H300mP1_34130 [Planctomycetaceae bacterium]|nr:MAG: hypothetical protein Ct9H300mP1_34130 [Planctomycetaceae bacterium]